MNCRRIWTYARSTCITWPHDHGGHFRPGWSEVIFCSHGRDEILFTGFRIAFWHFKNKHSDFLKFFGLRSILIISSNMLSSTCFQSTRLVVYLALVIVYASLHKKIFSKWSFSMKNLQFPPNFWENFNKNVIFEILDLKYRTSYQPIKASVFKFFFILSSFNFWSFLSTSRFLSIWLILKNQSFLSQKWE